MFKVGIILSVVVTLGACQLVCYTCNPRNDKNEECAHPVESGIRATACESQVNTTSLCTSSYVEHAEQNRSGIYRKCVNKPVAVADVCDWIKEEENSAGSNVTVKSCFSCNESRCNDILLYADGTSDAATFYNFYALVFINIVLVIIFGYSSN